MKVSSYELAIRRTEKNFKYDKRRYKMDIDLLSIQPHQVSRDMRGYIVFFYGD